jgi:hypothetical protein
VGFVEASAAPPLMTKPLIRTPLMIEVNKLRKFMKY